MFRMFTATWSIAAKIRTIYKSETFPTTGYGYAYNLDPKLVARSRRRSSRSVGRLLAQGGIQGLGSLRPITYKKDWSVIRKIDAANGVGIHLQVNDSADGAVGAVRRQLPRGTTPDVAHQGADQALSHRRPRAQGHRSRRAGRPSDGADRAVGRRQIDRHPLHQPAGRADRRHHRAQRHRDHRSRQRANCAAHAGAWA